MTSDYTPSRGENVRVDWLDARGEPSVTEGVWVDGDLWTPDGLVGVELRDVAADIVITPLPRPRRWLLCDVKEGSVVWTRDEDEAAWDAGPWSAWSVPTIPDDPWHLSIFTGPEWVKIGEFELLDDALQWATVRILHAARCVL